MHPSIHGHISLYSPPPISDTFFPPLPTSAGQSWPFGVCGSSMLLKKYFQAHRTIKIAHFWAWPVKITYPQSKSPSRKFKKLHFSFLEKLKITASAQLCSQPPKKFVDRCRLPIFSLSLSLSLSCHNVANVGTLERLRMMLFSNIWNSSFFLSLPISLCKQAVWTVSFLDGPQSGHIFAKNEFSGKPFLPHQRTKY